MTEMPQTPDPKKPKVELGFMSLFWIALIVAVCSGTEQRTDRKVEKLQRSVDRLEKKVDAMSAQQPTAPQAATTTAAPQKP